MRSLSVGSVLLNRFFNIVICCFTLLLWGGAGRAESLDFLPASSGLEEDKVATFYLDIPGQPLKDALVEFALQAEIDFIVSAELITGYQSVPLIGTYSLESGLNLLLDRTPLIFSLENGGVILEVDAVLSSNIQEIEVADKKFSGGIDEIVVTTRRREEALMDVPMSVAVMTGDELDAYGMTDFYRVGMFTPNLTVIPIRNTNSTVTAFIRGVGQEDPLVGFESGVGIYIDDVYINRPQSILAELYEADRIEILRGPQGVFYGKNSLGGAIKYVSKPLSNELDFNAKLTVGEYGQEDIVLSGGASAFDSRLKFGGVFASFHRDGFGRNVITGGENYNKDISAYRLSSVLELTERASINISYDKSEDNSDPRVGSDVHGLRSGQISPFDNLSGIDSFEHPVKKFSMEAEGLTVRFDWGDDALRIKSMHSLRKDTTSQPMDIDAGFESDLDTFVYYDNQQESHELQFIRNDGRWNILAGFYYLDADSYNAYDLMLPMFNAVRFSAADARTISKAVFLNTDIDFGDKVVFSLGGRYTQDKKQASIEQNIFVRLDDGILASPFFGGEVVSLVEPEFDSVGRQVVPVFSGSREDGLFTPRLGFSWYPKEQLHIFGTYSKGFKGGGFDPRGDYSYSEVRQGFSPELLSSYELGIKTKNDTSEVSAVLFTSDYDDIQIGGGISTGEASSLRIPGVTNDASAEMSGVEIEYRYVHSSNIDLDFSFGWIHSEYTQYVDLLGEDLSDTGKLTDISTKNSALSLNYHHFIESGVLSASISTNYHSSYWLFPDSLGEIEQPSFYITHAKFEWRSQEGKYRFGLYGHNIFNKLYKTGGRYMPAFDVSTLFYGEPRSVSVTVQYNF